MSKRVLRVSLTVVLIFTLLGCTTKKQQLKFGEPYANWPVQMNEETQKKFLDSLSDQHEQCSENAEKTMAKLKKSADKRTGYRLSLDATGIVCGIAAAALIVASPANAVYVAALNGITTGILAFESSAENEGLARTAVIRVYEEVRAKIEQADEEFGAAYGDMLRYTGDASETGIQNWRKSAAKAMVAMNKYERSILLLPLYGTEVPPKPAQGKEPTGEQTPPAPPTQ